MPEHRMVERWLSVALLVLAVGCGDDEAPVGGESGADDDGDSSGVGPGAGGSSGLDPTSGASSSAAAGVGGGPGGAAAAGGAGGAGAEGGGAGGAAGKPFGAKCSADADCASSTCHKFGKKGKRCTMACSADADCPDESPGCNDALVCKLAAGDSK